MFSLALTRCSPRVSLPIGILAVLLVSSTGDLAAKTLYVDHARGDDSVSYANNGPSKPWRTIERSTAGNTDRQRPQTAQAAQAGDLVLISAGTYTTIGNLTGGGGGRFDVAYNPINSGEKGRPIRFQAVGTVTLTYSSGAGPMIGSNSRNYIEWSGFTITEATAPTRQDTGPVIFFNVTGGGVEHSTLVGNPNWASRGGDNYTGVRLEDTRDVRIAANHIRDYGGQTGDRNHAGIETYRSAPLVIEHNEIVNCGSGIYLKGVSAEGGGIDSVTIRLNVLRENRWGINVLQQPMSEERPLMVYQNIFLGHREAAFWINMFENGRWDARWVRFFNNTLADNVGGIASYNNATFPANVRFLFRNNIIVGDSHALRQDTTDVKVNNTKDRQDFDRNVYFGSKGFGLFGQMIRNYQWWRDLGQDVNSRVVNPEFVGPADYRLSANSPARTIGRAVHGIGGTDGAVIPAGAYITGQEQIGPRPAPAAGEQR